MIEVMKVMVRGFLLNNQLTDFFSFSEEKNGELIANRVQPGKRPRSSISPFMVFDKDDQLVMEWDMDIQQAISMPHYVNRNGGADVER